MINQLSHKDLKEDQSDLLSFMTNIKGKELADLFKKKIMTSIVGLDEFILSLAY